MSKISELVLGSPEVKKYDFTIALFATLCAVASLATKTFLTFSGGSDAFFTIAAGYFAIGGNLILLSPKFLKSFLKTFAGKFVPFLASKSNFAFVLKTLGAFGFVVAGVLEDQNALLIGGGGLFVGNIIAMLKGYKVFSVAGYGVAVGTFLFAGLEVGNLMLTLAGASVLLETIFIAIYKNHDESRAEVVKRVWEEKKVEVENRENFREELEKMSTRGVGLYSLALMSGIYERSNNSLGTYFESEFSKYADREKQVIEESETDSQ